MDIDRLENELFSELDLTSDESERDEFKDFSSQKSELIVSDELYENGLSELIENSEEYAQWLRILILRVMARTSALGRLKSRFSFQMSQACQFLGFKNFENFSKYRTMTEIQISLEEILSSWEAEAGARAHMPNALHANLQSLAQIVGLSPIEKDVLGLAILVHSESVLEQSCEMLGNDLSGYSAERILAPMLGHKTDAVAKCLRREEKLAGSGLLTVDLWGRHALPQLLDLLTPTFAACMVTKQSDIRAIVDGFVKQAHTTSLTVQDYEHVQKDLNICKDLLKETIARRIQGVNILIYGRPGCGKTEFARLLAAELNLPMMEICSGTDSGDPIAPIRRVRNYRIAQSFFKSAPNAIFFDECEEIFVPMGLDDRMDGDANIPRKSWINHILEKNAVPTIWIANSIRQFDDAYLRRFSFCFEMPLPTSEQREKMLTKSLGGMIDQKTLTSISRNNEASPAMMAQTAFVVCTIANQKSENERNELALHLINNSLSAQNKPKVVSEFNFGLAGGEYNPQWVNCDVDLQALGESLVTARSGRLCLWGPPGTGKTAFGQWLAKRLDVPHLVVKASELLGPYLGETEQNMARAFETARQQNAVLQFDEVDSFLQDRQKASKQWEITQVNEMLTQMEKYSGVFIASTNLFDNLDEASLRRFDISIKFDYLKTDMAWAMFLQTCDVLGLTDAHQLRKENLAGFKNLTPGDFEQVIRRARLLRPTEAQQVLRALQSAVAYKKSSVSRPIGFLAAA